MSNQAKICSELSFGERQRSGSGEDGLFMHSVVNDHRKQLTGAPVIELGYPHNEVCCT